VETVWVPVVVAVIAGPLMWALHRFDRRNTEQHGENMKILNRVETKVDVLDAKVDRVDQRLFQHSNNREAHK
jgi:hypothetical protein